MQVLSQRFEEGVFRWTLLVKEQGAQPPLPTFIPFKPSPSPSPQPQHPAPSTHISQRTPGENFRFHAGLQAALLRLDAETAQKAFAYTHMDLPSTTLPLTDAQCALLAAYYEQHKGVFKARAYEKVVRACVRARFSRGATTILDPYLGPDLI